MTHKLKREKEKKILKERITELLDILGMSRRAWKKLNVKVEGSGLKVGTPQTRFKLTDKKVKWGRHRRGRKPGLKEQYSILWDFWQERLKNQAMFDELKEKMDSMNLQKEVENE